MQQGNVYINIGPYGTQSNDYLNFGLSGASGTNFGLSVASGTNFIQYTNNFGPSGTQSNVNVNIGASGTNFTNNNQLSNVEYQNTVYNNIISGVSLHNIYNKVGINDDDFNFQSGMLYDTKRKYELSYNGIFFDFIVDINELDNNNLICNSEFKKMLKYINLIINNTDDDRILRYLNRIINIDYFINKKIVRSIHITI